MVQTFIQTFTICDWATNQPIVWILHLHLTIYVICFSSELRGALSHQQSLFIPFHLTVIGSILLQISIPLLMQEANHIQQQFEFMKKHNIVWTVQSFRQLWKHNSAKKLIITVHKGCERTMTQKVIY